MQSLRNPKWVFLVNTVPVFLFVLVCWGEFGVIHTLLPVTSVAQWQGFGAVLAVLGVGATAYAGVQAVRRQSLGAGYSVLQLLAYSVWLCLLTNRSNELLPFGAVPRWMIPTDPILMAWTFLMPTLAHSLLVLVAKLTPDDRPASALPNMGLAVATPVGWWVLFMGLEWVEQHTRGTKTVPSGWVDAGAVLLVAVLVLSTLSFFFFLVRALFIITQRRNGVWSESSLVWKLLITIALPLLGLAVNAGLFFGAGFRAEGGIFGNFTSPWFYLLAVLNGALLCVPDSARPLPRLLQLLGRSVLFGYTFYFFLVFLPFLPLSIPAIILIGTGFLLLAPTLLFVVHVRQLSEDLAVVRMLYSKAVAVAVLVGGVAVLPLLITADYWHNRRVLHEALAYVYTPNYAQAGRIDATALASTLTVVRQHKDSRVDFLSGSQLPYLSTYFNWLVLDNLMLSESKLNDLDRIFSGAGPAPLASVGPLVLSTGPELRGLAATSTYDAAQQAWVSWVNLEVANRDAQAQNQEYSTVITLPTGCWVSDYYLTIGNRQERGILAEKRAATWVFAQIVSENANRDPGLLSYQGPNSIAVRVYPVTGAQVRRTRIQLLHKEPCSLTIDGRTIALGTAAAAPPVAAPVSTPDGGVFYLSPLAKRRLPLVRRRPYYHFLLDASGHPTTHAAAYRQRVARLLARPLPNGGPARFSLVDAYATPIAAGTQWEQGLRGAHPEGGCYLTGAIRRVLFEAQDHPAATYPVLVVVTDSLANTILNQDFEDLRGAYPESDKFYVLGPDGRLRPHSLRRHSPEPAGSSTALPEPAPAVRAWPTAVHPLAYLPNADEADVVPGRSQAVPSAALARASRWLTGLQLQGYTQWQNFHPETTDQERVPFIQASFRAGIMTPFTSFLALENEAQKAALRRKQGQTLAANASLDTLENDQVQPTSTPIDSGVIFLTAAALLLAWWCLRSRAALR